MKARVCKLLITKAPSYQRFDSSVPLTIYVLLKGPGNICVGRLQLFTKEQEDVQLYTELVTEFPYHR